MYILLSLLFGWLRFRFWTVTGDKVSSMTMADAEGDGENKLLVGSDDFEVGRYLDTHRRAPVLLLSKGQAPTDVKGCFVYNKYPIVKRPFVPLQTRQDTILLPNKLQRDKSDTM